MLCVVPLDYLSIFTSLPNCICSLLSIFSANVISFGSSKEFLPSENASHVLRKFMKSHHFHGATGLYFAMSNKVYNANVLDHFEKCIRNGMLWYDKWQPGLPGEGVLAGEQPHAPSSITASVGLLFRLSFRLGHIRYSGCRAQPPLPDTLPTGNTFFFFFPTLHGGWGRQKRGELWSQPLSVYTKCPESGKMKAQPPFSSVTRMSPTSRLWWTQTADRAGSLSAAQTGPRQREAQLTQWVKETAAKKGVGTESFSLWLF